MIPRAYEWLKNEKPPRLGREALRLYGTIETPGPKSNPVILAWAKELGGPVGSWYDDDAEAWCGLYMAVCVLRAGYVPPAGFNALRALQWARWGRQVATPMLWDVLVFKREGGGHVGLYIGEDKDAYHVLGGNQSNAVSITRIRKNRFHAAVRCPYKNERVTPRRIHLRANGAISENEI